MLGKKSWLMTECKLNNEFNGVELYFDNIPSVTIRDAMKANGWRWNGKKKCWYNRQTEANISFAQALSGETPTVAKPAQAKPQKTKIAPVETTEVEMTKRYCYADTVDNFLDIDETDWINEMKTGFGEAYMLSLGVSQINAWRDCFRVLQRELPDFNNEYPNFHIVFEYALPYESGRRPDVLLISIEFLIIL